MERMSASLVRASRRWLKSPMLLPLTMSWSRQNLLGTHWHSSKVGLTGAPKEDDPKEEEVSAMGRGLPKLDEDPKFEEEPKLDEDPWLFEEPKVTVGVESNCFPVLLLKPASMNLGRNITGEDKMIS